jgi:hypothetical protein
MTGRLRRDDQGSVLVAALIAISVLTLLVGTMLSYSYTSFKNTGVSSSTLARLYASDGVADGAALALSTNQYTGIYPYSSSACFSMNENLNAAGPGTVTCTARSGSGALQPGTALASQPRQAVLALGSGTEGVTQAASTTQTVQGDVYAAGTVSQGAAATMTVSGSVTGGTCAASGTISPTCYAPNVSTYADPATDGTYPAGVWAGPATYPATRTAPACTTNSATPIQLQPGTYSNQAALQALLNCSGSVIWFLPGIYYFDFGGVAATTTGHELSFDGNATGTVVVAGAKRGAWTTVASVPAVTYDTTAMSTSTACDPTLAGVEFIFGSDVHLNVKSGKFEVCSYLPQSASTAQQIAFYGFANDTTVASTSVASSASTSATAANPLQGNRNWSTPANSTTVNNQVASAHVPNKGDYSEFLDIGGFSTTGIPVSSTSISVTATVTGLASGSGELHALFTYSGGSQTDTILANCPTQTTQCNGLMQTYSLSTTTPLTYAQYSTLKVRLYVYNPANAPIDASIDGVSATATFPSTFFASSGVTRATGYAPGSTTAAPLIKVSGAYPSTQFAVHGTIYAPLCALDLAETAVPYTVVDRGVVIRHLYDAMNVVTPTPPLIAIPMLPRAPREVVVSVVIGGVTDLIADVKLTDTAAISGTANGKYVHVLQWSHQ